MKTSIEWAEIYMKSPVLKLYEVFKMAQEEAIEETVKACDKNVVSGSMRSRWETVEQELKAML